MNVLLIGGGGREHALAWKLAQSPRLGKLYAAPGNPGIAQHAACVALDVGDHAAVIAFCRAHEIGLVVIGPEQPLVDGLADSLADAGVAAFGPSAAAAQLEGSKGFTKDLCAEFGIPTAAFVRHTDRLAARADAGRYGYPVVIKADGLAAGKGVVIAENHADALAAIDAQLDGTPGAAIVIEEFMAGEEASLFALSDGKTVRFFASAQDHKRVGDGDTGPNTGGMGAYSPAPVLTPALQEQAMREIVEPTVRAMAARGTPFAGVLYAGLMLTKEGPKLVEYNARFGDPETQVMMPRFEGDLLALLRDVATGRLADCPAFAFSDRVCLTVVMAAKGYPGALELGGAIQGLDQAEALGATVFQAGTSRSAGLLQASGGRVLGITGCATSIKQARAIAYHAIAAIDFPTGFCRHDIGYRELERAGK